MQKLVEGVRKFQSSFKDRQELLFKKLAGGQAPLALFITCSDSRIVPDLLMQTEPGELFILRTAGNIVPPYDTLKGGEAATIEYAVKVLKVKDIVVCGHSHCGAMAGLIKPEAVQDLPAVKALLSLAEPTRQYVEENCPSEDSQERLMAAIKHNVVTQLENLRTHPAVAEALAEKRLGLHGWVYKFESGDVYTCNPQNKEFCELQKDASLAQT